MKVHQQKILQRKVTSNSRTIHFLIFQNYYFFSIRGLDISPKRSLIKNNVKTECECNMDFSQQADLPLKSLFQAFQNIENFQEFKSFLSDLCTPFEINAMTERWQVAKLLYKKIPYRKIHEMTGASLATITRVARFLKQEPYRGYMTLLHRIS